MNRRKVAIAITGFGALAYFGYIAYCGYWNAIHKTDNDPASFAVSFVGMLANVAVAIAAFLAFVFWRYQLEGETKHQLARRLALATYRLERATKPVFDGARKIGRHSRQDMGELSQQLFELDEAAKALHEFAGEMRVVWEPEIATPVTSLADNCTTFVSLVVDVRDHHDNTYAKAVIENQTTLEETIGCIELEIALVDAWVAFSLRQEDARKMSTEEVIRARLEIWGVPDKKIDAYVADYVAKKENPEAYFRKKAAEERKQEQLLAFMNAKLKEQTDRRNREREERKRAFNTVAQNQSEAASTDAPTTAMSNADADST